MFFFSVHFLVCFQKFILSAKSLDLIFWEPKSFSKLSIAHVVFRGKNSEWFSSAIHIKNSKKMKSLQDRNAFLYSLPPCLFSPVGHVLLFFAAH